MSSLESVDSISSFVVQFAVVKEYTLNMCIAHSDFDCISDCSALKKVCVLKACIAIICLLLMYVYVSSKLASNLLVTSSDYFTFFCLRFVHYYIAFCPSFFPDFWKRCEYS